MVDSLEKVKGAKGARYCNTVAVSTKIKIQKDLVLKVWKKSTIHVSFESIWVSNKPKESMYQA